MTTVSAAEIESCAAEPIRIPGAIQPHGAMIVLDRASLRVLHTSANLEALTGLTARPGDSLAELPGLEALLSETRRWLEGGDPALLRVIELPRSRMQAFGHVTPQGVLIEFESPPETEADTLEGMYPRLRRFLDAISTAEDIRSIAEAAVKEVRALTGFNRVLLYSFDEKGDGTVLSEDGDGVLPSYLGQRFPAADIPAQARALYTLNRLRLIADADYTPVPIIPSMSAVDGKPLDLSQSALRSVSPVHLEYMRNMGTGSSMSISIIVNGELWGLISGHSRAPRKVNAQVRTACDILGQVLSLQIDSRQQAHRTSERLELKQIETDLLGGLASVRSFQTGLFEHADLWMSLTHSQGAAVITQGQVLAVGMTPPDEDIRALSKLLHEDQHEIFATDSLTEIWPEAERFAPAASGLLAISISQIHPDYIMWFRPEVVRTIEWSGDPTKTVDPRSDRLHPRKSFEIWREQVRLRSPPWRDVEVESAKGFRSSIQNLVLRRAEERAEMTERLERANKELESFSYSISHDLRAPFRHIVGYAELLADKERNLDAKSLHYIQTVKEAAVSAGRLVDDLLHFSQLGRSQLAVTKVDMRKLVSEVLRSLEPDMIGRKIEWKIEKLPSAWGDASMLRQVFQNLLQNALKYSRNREVAEISISGRDDGESVSYTVSDNGVGFEMAYVGKLFGVFQRLHRSEEFEGTGIGLALVKRITDRHGGSVEAQGNPGRGAAFTFTLPNRPNSKGTDPRG